MMISDLYGKQIITNSGRKIGFVEDVIVDFEAGSIASLLLVKLDELSRGENVAMKMAKNSVRYERVKNITESIIVSEK